MSWVFFCYDKYVAKIINVFSFLTNQVAGAVFLDVVPLSTDTCGFTVSLKLGHDVWLHTIFH